MPLRRPLQTHLRLGQGVALALGGALRTSCCLLLRSVPLGPELATQMRTLFTTLPEAAHRLLRLYFQLGSMVR